MSDSSSLNDLRVESRNSVGSMRRHEKVMIKLLYSWIPCGCQFHIQDARCNSGGQKHAISLDVVSWKQCSELKQVMKVTLAT